jgi:hypothetical protein
LDASILNEIYLFNATIDYLIVLLSRLVELVENIIPEYVSWEAAMPSMQRLNV